MKEEQLTKANAIKNEIYHIEEDLRHIDKILANYDDYASTIEFKTSGFSRSFGTKEYGIKPKLKFILIAIQSELHNNIDELRKEFDKI